MPNWGWLALGAAIAWIIATDDFHVEAAAIGNDGRRDYVPQNDVSARAVNDWQVRFQAPGSDTINDPQMAYGSGMGNRIGGGASNPIMGSMAVESGGLAQSRLQGGYVIGRGWY